MAEAPKSATEIVNDLSQPGKEAELAKVISEEFSEKTTPAEVKPAATDAPVENKDDNPDNKDDLSKAGDNKAGEDNKNDRVKDLLADRNEARNAAAEAQTTIQTLSKKLEDQGKLLEQLLSGKAGEGDGEKPSADDLKGKTMQQLINEEIDRREAAKNANSDAEKSITDAIQALESNPETPKSKEFSADIKALMVKHPTISAYMAYMALVGSGKIPSDTTPSNANRTGTGKRSKTNLVDNKPVGDQSQAELEAQLRAAEKSGTLGV